MPPPLHNRPPSPAPATAVPPPGSARALGWAWLCLTVAFAWPLAQLAVFAWRSRLYSHVAVVPLFSAILLWRDRRLLAMGTAALRRWAAGPALAGMILLVWLLASRGAATPWDQDRLALVSAAFVAGAFAVALWFLDRAGWRRVVFPLAFLVFMIPFPAAVEAALETGLQHGSALMARGLFAVAAAPVSYDDLIFSLPGVNLQVAPECSGIHSTLVLLITSVVAARFFLRSSRRRLVLVASIVPLGLLRNGCRIFVLGELCLRRGPQVLDTWIHHQGGPLFFALSLVPLCGLLVLLLRAERAADSPGLAP